MVRINSSSVKESGWYRIGRPFPVANQLERTQSISDRETKCAAESAGSGLFNHLRTICGDTSILSASDVAVWYPAIDIDLLSRAANVGNVLPRRNLDSFPKNNTPFFSETVFSIAHPHDDSSHLWLSRSMLVCGKAGKFIQINGDASSKEERASGDALQPGQLLAFTTINGECGVIHAIRSWLKRPTESGIEHRQQQYRPLTTHQRAMRERGRTTNPVTVPRREHWQVSSYASLTINGRRGGSLHCNHSATSSLESNQALPPSTQFKSREYFAQSFQHAKNFALALTGNATGNEGKFA